MGISGLISFNSSATMNVFVLGSIRTIRDFTEGPSILYPQVQNATKFSQVDNNGISLNRVWLDNMTQTTLSFIPAAGSNGSVKLTGNNMTTFSPGIYNFTASYDYPQLVQLNASSVLNPQSQGLIAQDPSQTDSLSFLSYTTKLLAGGWRFLTYFGRDSQIAALLLQPVLSEGESGAIEAVIAAVLSRLNQSDGSVCHEETIGDYATFVNQQNNITSTAPYCSYIMIDSDYYLPIVLQNYFVNTTKGKQRAADFFATQSPNDFGNGNLTYGQLALINAEKIMNTSAPFAAQQTVDNLIHIKPGQIVGEWRDSTYGIGGGKIPYDVNTALVPAALRAIGVLANSKFFPEHPEWKSAANQYAQVWEDNSLQFFNNTIPEAQAQSLVKTYVSESNFSGPSNVNNITGDVTFFSLSLEGNNNLSTIQVMNTDDCFRHFLLNTTNQTQLSAFLSQTANNILQPFPTGLSTDVGLVVANPAYGGNPVYETAFKTILTFSICLR